MNASMDSTCEIPEEEAVHIAEEELARLRIGPRTGNVIEQPAQLQPGKVSGQRKTGLLAETVGTTLLRERATKSATRVSCHTSAL